MKKALALVLVVAILAIGSVSLARASIINTARQSYSGSFVNFVTTQTYNNLPTGGSWMSFTSENSYSRRDSTSGPPADHKIWAVQSNGGRISYISSAHSSGSDITVDVLDTCTQISRAYLAISKTTGSTTDYTMYAAGEWFATYGTIY